MLREATYPPAAVNVLDVSSESMAAFQVFMYGRFWVFTEESIKAGDKAPEQIILFFSVALACFVASYLTLKYRTKNLFGFLSDGFIDNGFLVRHGRTSHRSQQNATHDKASHYGCGLALVFSGLFGPELLLPYSIRQNTAGIGLRVLLRTRWRTRIRAVNWAATPSVPTLGAFWRFASFSVRIRLWFVVLAGGLIPGQALADDLRRGQLEAVEIVHFFVRDCCSGYACSSR